MTKDEAIKAIRDNWPDSRYTMLREALVLAIKALEKQSQLVPTKEELYKKSYEVYPTKDNSGVIDSCSYQKMRDAYVKGCEDIISALID